MATHEYTLAVTVLLWWMTKTISDILSESALNLKDDITVNPGSIGNGRWTKAFGDLRWLELTLLQQLLGIAASVSILIFIMKKPVWPSGAHKGTIFLVTVVNVIGNLAMNAAFTLVMSSATQIIGLFQPISTFLLSICLYKNSQTFNFSTVLSIVTMFIGACTFAVLDSNANYWSVIAAVASNISFALFTIYFKKWLSSKEKLKDITVAEKYKSTVQQNYCVVQKYAAISICGMVLLLPLILIKVVFTRVIFAHFQAKIMYSSTLHFIYSLSSISVLQEVSPVSHAILYLCREVVLTLLKMVYFHHPPYTLSVSVVTGLLVFLSGLGLYCFKNGVKNILKFTAIAALISFGCIYYQGNHFLMTNTVSIQIPRSNLLHCPTTHIQYSPAEKPAIFTAWSFARSVPFSVVQNIERLKVADPSLNIHVYCGNSQCACTMAKLKTIYTHFLVVSDLVRDTPLEQWLDQHPLNKILVGSEFENHLQRVVQLGILWKHGGIYVDPMVILSTVSLHEKCGENGWTGKKDSLDVACFPKHSPFINQLMKLFVSQYPRVNGSSMCHSSSGLLCPKTLSSPYTKRRLNSEITKYEPSFGSFGHDHQHNLVESMEIFSGIQFLPFLDHSIQTHYSNTSFDNTTLFLGSLWDAESVHPIMISICVDPSLTKSSMWNKAVEYLKINQPIGCCDVNTLDILIENGVESYISGSLALMLQMSKVNKERTEILVDVDEKVKKLLPPRIRKSSVDIRKLTSNLQEYSIVLQYLESCASAKLIITQNISSALPCVAMGTAVVFVNLSTTSIGRSVYNESDILQYVHEVDIDNLQEWLRNFNWNNPPPNPNLGLLMRRRATMWNVIRQNQALYDAARMFGTIPMKLPITSSKRNRLIFHVVFTTSIKSKIKLFKSSIFDWVLNWHSDTVKGTFNWRHWRSIESIFYHHPLAKVIVHSNTLEQSLFDVLTEVGYDIEVLNYNLEKMLKGSPAEKMIETLPIAREDKYWYSHETDLLRTLALYNWGGVYMDTDVVVVRPVDSLHNVIAWQAVNSEVNGAVLIFNKGNDYIRTVLEEFPNRYRTNCWGCVGPGLLTRVYFSREDWNGLVTVEKNTWFYMFHPSQVEPQCFSLTSKEIFDANMKTLREEAYMVHLNSKITAKKGVNSALIEGTVCKHLLNSFCVLCNYQY